MTATLARPIGLTVLAALMLVWAAPARAATVVIVRPANPPPAIVETLVRLNGELLSVGFATEFVDEPVVDKGAGHESRGWLEQLAGRRKADALVAIVGAAAPDSVEVWVIDKVTGKSVVRRVPFEAKAEHAQETLAIRALELLRSSFIEIDFAVHHRPRDAITTPPPTVVHFVEMERLASHPERFGIEVGGATVMSLDGVGPAVLPSLGFAWPLRSWFLVQMAVAGLGTRATVQSKTSSAQVAQGYGVLGACFRPSPGQRLRPFAVLSAGVLHTSVEGRADPPSQGRSADQWSFLLDGGLGTWLRLPDRFYLALAVHAQVAEPYLAVRFVDTVAATSGRPNLLLTLTIGAWL
jgi:hypothetical protein